MTDSATQSKRERLIDAARQTVYEHGIEKTTLADIAAQADIPVGNVYYYFKTKNDIVRAVVESHVRESRTLLAAIEDDFADARDRLKALFGGFAQQSDLIARYGCPHGSLCLELDKRADGAALAEQLMREPVDWAERQFLAMGRPDARDLAIQVIARYQGTALLTSTFRDPDLMAREADRVAQWIDTLDLPLTPAYPVTRSRQPPGTFAQLTARNAAAVLGAFVAEPCAGNTFLSRAVENRFGEAEPDLPVVSVDRAPAHRTSLFIHIPTLAHRTEWAILFCRWSVESLAVLAADRFGVCASGI